MKVHVHNEMVSGFAGQKPGTSSVNSSSALRRFPFPSLNSLFLPPKVLVDRIIQSLCSYIAL